MRYYLEWNTWQTCVYSQRNSLLLLLKTLTTSCRVRWLFLWSRDWLNLRLSRSIIHSLLAQQVFPCKAFTVIWQYSLLANYNWILMEGIYLHNLIFLYIFNDNSSILPYVLAGWGMGCTRCTLPFRSIPDVWNLWDTRTAFAASLVCLIWFPGMDSFRYFILLFSFSLSRYIIDENDACCSHLNWNNWFCLRTCISHTIGLPVLFILPWTVVRALYEDTL